MSLARVHRVILTVGSAVCVFLIVFAAAFASAISVANDKGFYDRQFIKHNVAEALDTELSEVQKVRDVLLDFLFGDTDHLENSNIMTPAGEIPFYNESAAENEISHMEDVKAVFTAVRNTGLVFASLALIIIAALIIFFTARGKKLTLEPDAREYRRLCLFTASRGGIYGLAATGVFVIMFGAAVIIDFDALFIVFHDVFFPQGNWQFSYKSNMLKMLPEELFNAAAIRIVVVTVLTAAVIAAAAICGYIKTKNKKHSNP